MIILGGGDFNLFNDKTSNEGGFSFNFHGGNDEVMECGENSCGALFG